MGECVETCAREKSDVTGAVAPRRAFFSRPRDAQPAARLDRGEARRAAGRPRSAPNVARRWRGALGAVAAIVLAGCGGGAASAPPADGSADGAPSSSGGSVPQDAPSASSSGAGADAALLAPGGASLVGPSAFSVSWARMDPSEPDRECGPNAVDGGGFAATAIDLFEDIGASLACADAGPSDAGVGRIVDIEIATAPYSNGVEPPPAALAPGVYPILDEEENDEDLCSEPSNGPVAILQVLEFGLYDAQQIAVSGTVTIDSVTSQAVTGRLDVLLGGPYGQTDGAPPSLSGTFNAVACP